MDNMSNVNEIDIYISKFTPEVQEILSEVRRVIKAAAPLAEEKIGYQMPGYYLNGPVVYFAAFKNHIGFFPTGTGTEGFAEEFSQYKGGKGSVQFPYSKPIPYDLIRRVTEVRYAQNLEKNKK